MPMPQAADEPPLYWKAAPSTSASSSPSTSGGGVPPALIWLQEGHWSVSFRDGKVFMIAAISVLAVRAIQLALGAG